jgi:hypothetical protein
VPQISKTLARSQKELSYKIILKNSNLECSVEMETDCSYSKSITWNSSHPPRHFPPSYPKLAIYYQGGRDRAKWNEVEEVKTGNLPQGWEL